MSSSSSHTGGFLPGNARVVMGAGMAGPSEMTVHQIEGTKTQVLDEKTEAAFWERVRARAEEKARGILNQAMAEAAAIRDQARQEGIQAGLAEAGQACQAHLASLGQTLASLLAGIEADRVNLWTRHRQEFAQLLRLGVEKTLRVELSERRREVLASLLEQAVELLDTRQGFSVVVAPGDEADVSELLAEARKVHPALGAWRVKTDPAMTPGGARLESEAGMADNAVDTRFEQISDLLDRVAFTGEQP
jgi:flagellar assembly protein FliH